VKKTLIFGLVGAVAIATIALVAQLAPVGTVTSSERDVINAANKNSENGDDNDNGTRKAIAIGAEKSRIENQISNATYYTFANATTPASAIDPKSGTIYVAFFRAHNGSGNMFIQRSDDGGKTFSAPVRVNNKEGDGNLSAQWSAPALAVGPKGEVYAAWYHNENPDPAKYPWGITSLQFTRSLDGGKIFEPARDPTPNDPIGERSYPYMVVSKDNHIYISYLNLDYSKDKDVSGTPSFMRVVSSMDGGKTFGESRIADKSACQCCATVAAIGPDNEVYASSRSTFQGTASKITNETRTDYMGHHNDIVVIRDITVEHSTDNGIAQNFTEPSKVGNDNWFMNGCPDAGPGMAFDSNGRMHLAWFTGSESASQGQGFYYTHSDDKGATFSKPVPIHLLSEKWIPPTTQYLVVDKNDNAWITFVNSEGLRKSATYDKDYSFTGNGTVVLAVVDKDGNILRNGSFATGNITKHYPFTTSANGKIVISWIDGGDIKLATIDTTARSTSATATTATSTART
jgi:hypothetical protein